VTQRPRVLGRTLLLTMPLLACTPDVPDPSTQETAWRAYAAAESSGAWRKHYPNHALSATADFDGDGRDDHATLKINTADGALALAVSRTALGAAQVHHREWLERFDNVKTREIGITVAPPGTYTVACDSTSDAAVPCGPNDRRTITLSTPAIKLFEFESASLLVFWDRTESTFRKEWLSD
jgi:hypothetical protein